MERGFWTLTTMVDLTTARRIAAPISGCRGISRSQAGGDEWIKINIRLIISSETVNIFAPVMSYP